jgi:Spy/CpxP family protein refolding chaperone
MMFSSRLVAVALTAIVSIAGIAGAQGTGRASARAGKHPNRGLMRGLDLTADEKVKLKGVHEQYKDQAKTLRESMKPALQEARAARQKGDTASARAIIQRTEGTRDKMRQLMLAESNDVRATLTPEQQKKFDANRKLAADRRAKRAKKLGARRGKFAKPANV